MQEKPKGSAREYWCFISYRHSDNRTQGRDWASWLHRELETYEVPPELAGRQNQRKESIPARIFPVFRDEEELPADADLTTPIRRALEASRFLIVICSPAASASRFVNEEVRYFKSLGRADRVLAMIIRGEPNVSDDPEKIALGFSEHDECFPLALRRHVKSGGDISAHVAEPIGADFRIHGIEEGWTSSAAHRRALKAGSRLRGASLEAEIREFATRRETMKLKLIAGILGVPLGVLTQRDHAHQLQQKQRRARVLRRWIAALSAASAIALLAAAWGLYKGREESLAREQAGLATTEAQRQKTAATEEKSLRTAKQREAASQHQRAALDLARSGKSREALAHLAAAIANDPDSLAAPATAVTILGSPGSSQLALCRTVSLPDSGPAWNHYDGSAYVFRADGNTVEIRDLASGSQAVTLQTQLANILEVKIDSRLELAAVMGPASIQTFSLKTGDPLRTFNAPPPDDSITSIKGSGAGAELAKHLGDLVSFSFVDHGRYLTAASRDCRAFVWDSSTGAMIKSFAWDEHWAVQWRRQFPGKPVPALDVTFAETVRLIQEAKAQGFELNEKTFLALGEDKPLLVAAAPSGTIKLWNLTSGAFVAGSERIGKKIKEAVVTPDCSLVATLTESGDAVHIWEAASGELLAAISLDGTGFKSLQISPDGARFLVSGSDKGIVRVGELAGSGIQASLGAASTEINGAAFSPDGRRIVTTSTSGEACVWDAESGSEIFFLRGVGGIIATAGFADDGKSIATLSTNGMALVWENGSSTLDVLFDQFEIETANWSEVTLPDILRTSAKMSVDVDPTGARLVTANRGAFASIRETATGKHVADLRGHADWVPAAKFSPSGNHIATASHDGMAILWDAATGKPVRELRGHQGHVLDVNFDPSGNKVVTTGEDRTLMIWDAGEGTILRKISAQADLSGGRFDQTGNLILAAAFDGRALAWEASTGNEVASLPPAQDRQPGGQNSAAIFDGTGGRCVTFRASDSSINLWDVRGGKKLAAFQPYGAFPLACFDKENRLLAASLQDNSVRIWAAESGAPVSACHGHTDMLYGLAFDPTGRVLVSSSRDESLRVWDAGDGAPLGVFDLGGESAETLTFDHQGNTVLVSQGSRLHAFQVLGSSTACPSWFGPFLEYLGNCAIDSSGVVRTLSPAEREELAARISAAYAADASRYGQIARCFLPGPGERLVSPGAAITRSQCVESLIHAGADDDQIHRASALLPWHPLCQLALARVESSESARTFLRNRALPAMRGDAKLLSTAVELLHEQEAPEKQKTLDLLRAIDADAAGRAESRLAQIDSEQRARAAAGNAVASTSPAPPAPARRPTAPSTKLFHDFGIEVIDSIKPSPSGEFLAAAAGPGPQGSRIHVAARDQSGVLLSLPGRELAWRRDSETLVALRETSGQTSAVACTMARGETPKTAELGFKLKSSAAEIWRLSPDGSLAATALGSWFAIWDVSTGSRLGNRSLDHKSPVARIEFSPSSRYVASIGRDKTLKVWDTRAGTELKGIGFGDSKLVDVKFSADDGVLVCCLDHSFLSTAKIWRLPDFVELGGGPVLPESAIQCDAGATGKKVLIRSSRYVQVFDVDNLLKQDFQSNDFIADAIFSPAGDRVCVADVSGTVRMITTDPLKTAASVSASTAAPKKCVFTPDGRQLFVLTADNKVMKCEF